MIWKKSSGKNLAPWRVVAKGLRILALHVFHTPNTTGVEPSAESTIQLSREPVVIPALRPLWGFAGTAKVWSTYNLPFAGYCSRSLSCVKLGQRPSVRLLESLCWSMSQDYTGSCGDHRQQFKLPGSQPIVGTAGRS
jgi:hypothetical protein